MPALIFDLGHRQAPSYDNFHVSRTQQDAFNAVKELTAGHGTAASHGTAAGGSSPGAYLWGVGGIGKSHLLLAAASAAVKAGIGSTALSGNAPGNARGLVAVDDIESLDDAAQLRLLELLKTALGGAHDLIVLAAGRQAPTALRLREDLRTRLCTLPVYRIEKPQDPDLEMAIVAYTRRLGRELPRPVARELVFSLRRDMASLTSAVNEIDRRAVEEDHTLSAALVRKWLAQKKRTL